MPDYARMYRERFSAALIADSAFRVGVRLEVGPPGLTALDPWAMPAGPVLTIAARNDLVSILEAVHVATEGDVILIGESSHDVGLIGDLIGTEAVRKRLGGFVVDGLVRDGAELTALGVPVACRGVFPVGPLKLPADDRGIGAVGDPVRIGEATVEPGMWAFGDGDGVVFCEAGDLPAVFSSADRAYASEQALAGEIRGGTPLGDIFALDDFLQARAADPSANFNDHLSRIGRVI